RARCWPRRGRRGSRARCRIAGPLFLQFHSGEVVGEPALQFDDAQRAASLRRAADLLAHLGELVEAVDAREAADVLAQVADRGEVARVQRLAQALEVAAAVLEESGQELLHRGLGAQPDLVHHAACPWSVRQSVASSTSTFTGFAR